VFTFSDYGSDSNPIHVARKRMNLLTFTWEEGNLLSCLNKLKPCKGMATSGIMKQCHTVCILTLGFELSKAVTRFRAD